MWAYVPDFQVIMISEKGGSVKSAQGVSAVADYSFATAPQLNIMSLAFPLQIGVGLLTFAGSLALVVNAMSDWTPGFATNLENVARATNIPISTSRLRAASPSQATPVVSAPTTGGR